MTKWSYKVVAVEVGPYKSPYTDEEKVRLTGAELITELGLAIGPSSIERELNLWGEGGWELVAVVPRDAAEGLMWNAIFKRPY